MEWVWFWSNAAVLVVQTPLITSGFGLTRIYGFAYQVRTAQDAFGS